MVEYSPGSLRALMHVIEDTFSIESVSRSYVISQLLLSNPVPIQTLTQLSCIQSFHPDREMVLNSIQMSHLKSFFSEKHQNFKIPFKYTPNTLILSNVDQSISTELLQNYASILTTASIKITPQGQSTFSLLFPNMEELFSFWRALSIVPLNGHLLQGHLELKPIPAYVSKSRCQKSKKLQKDLQSQKKKLNFVLKTKNFPSLSSL